MNAPSTPDILVVYRLSRLQVAIPVAAGYFLALILLIAFALTGGSPALGEVGLLCGPVLAIAVISTPRPSRSIQLTPHALITQRGFHKRTIPWADIAHLEIRKSFGIRTLTAHTVHRKAYNLPAPSSLADPEFDVKAAAVFARLTVRNPHLEPRRLPPGQ